MILIVYLSIFYLDARIVRHPFHERHDGLHESRLLGHVPGGVPGHAQVCRAGDVVRYGRDGDIRWGHKKEGLRVRAMGQE